VPTFGGPDTVFFKREQNIISLTSIQQHFRPCPCSKPTWRQRQQSGCHR